MKLTVTHRMNLKGEPMDTCPTCGVELSAALVASIKDQNQPENCYRETPAPAPEKRRLDEISEAQRRLTAYMMIGAHFAA